MMKNFDSLSMGCHICDDPPKPGGLCSKASLPLPSAPDLALPLPELTSVCAAARTAVAGRWEAEVRRWRPEAAGPVPSRVSWERLEVVGRAEGSGKTSAREALGGGGAPVVAVALGAAAAQDGGDSQLRRPPRTAGAPGSARGPRWRRLLSVPTALEAAVAQDGGGSRRRQRPAATPVGASGPRGCDGGRRRLPLALGADLVGSCVVG